MSLPSILMDHVVRLFALRHRGEGLHISSVRLLSVIIALPVLSALVVEPGLHEVIFRVLLIIVLIVAHPRCKSVGVTLIWLTSDAVVMASRLIGIPYMEVAASTWGLIAIIVFMFAASRTQTPAP